MFKANRILIFLLGGAMLAACGGGGGQDPAPAAQQTGRVTVSVSDAPPTAEFAKILMVIREIRFIGPGGQDILVMSEPREIDFLALSNFSEVLVRRDIVTGQINKIRLILDSLTLERADGSTESVSLNGLDKIDLNPRGPIQVRAGDDILIDIEVALDKSIHIVGNGNGRYKFRPVIFVRVSTEPAFDKLFRVAGTVDELFAGDEAFLLCDLRRVADDSQRPNPREICIRVDGNDDTSYFDDEANAGGEFGDLVVNDRVVVYGKFDPAAAGDTLIPSVVAIGEAFDRVKGIAASDFDPGTESFDLDAANGLCVVTPEALLVGVVEQAPVYFENDAGAELVTREDIVACRETEAEGYMVDPGEHLRAFVVLLGAPGPETLTGTLTAVEGTPDEYDLEPVGGGDTECVRTDADTQLVTIDTTVSPTTVDTALFDGTAPAGEVTVIGARDGDDCLVADEIVEVIE